MRLPEADFVIRGGCDGGVWLELAGDELVAAGCLTSGVIIELAQGRYSDTRSVELDDIVADGAGVAIGTCAVALMYLIWNGLASRVKLRHQE